MRGISRLAKELGISTATVSRALNGKPRVQEETRQRVLEAASRIGYEPNRAARNLALGQTRSIGFMFDLDPEIAAAGDNFFMSVFDGVQNVIAPHGLDLVVLPCPRSQHRHAYLERMIAGGSVDGMIISGTVKTDTRIELLHSAGVPFVALGRSTAENPFSWVDLDFEGVAESSVDRLVQMGHRRIAITVPFGDLTFGGVFVNAYRKALRRHGIPFDPDLVLHTGLAWSEGALLVDTLLDRPDPATAVILIFEAAAIGIYERLAERGLQPGVDLSVIGFRSEAVVQHLRPALTCFDLSLFDVGAALGSALLAQIPGRRNAASTFTQVRIPLALRPGESDGPPAAGRRTVAGVPARGKGRGRASLTR